MVFLDLPKATLSTFLKRLEQTLNLQREKDLWRRLEVAKPCRIDLSSNDYLQLRGHPEVVKGAQKVQHEFGTSSGASPLISGYLACHARLLDRLKQWKQKPFGLLFNSGFITNQAVLKHLPGPEDLILADRLVHHSMVQAFVHSQAKFKRYRHIDIDHLEELLYGNFKNFKTVYVITESVFSMDGDYPNLKRLAQLKNQFPFIWVLDEAHATGCFGPTGGGLAEKEGVLDSVDILIGTLGKALGSSGGYILTAYQEVVDYLVNFAGELIYSTYLPPACTGSAIVAIDLVQTASDNREYLTNMSLKFRKDLENSGWKTNSFNSQIVPIMIGTNAETIRISNRLRNAGIRVSAVRPPTVPEGSARLRISLHTQVTQEHLQELLAILNTCRNL